MTRVTIAPQLRRHALLVAQALPTGALQVAKNMLDSLLVCHARVPVEATQAADSCSDVWSRTYRQVHEGAYGAAVRDECPFLCLLL